MADSFYEQALSNGRQSAPRKKTSRARARTKDELPPLETAFLLDIASIIIDEARRNVAGPSPPCPQCGRSPTNT